MLNIPLMLAQEGDAPAAAATNPLAGFNLAIRQHPDLLNQPEALSGVLREIPLIWAMVLFVVGALCVVYGYRSHKLMVTILAAMTGVWVGLSVGDKSGDATITAACLALLFGVLAFPLLKFSVALFGGMCGAFAGANLLTTGFAIVERTGYTIPQELTELRSSPYVGAFIGLVIVGMLAFIAFRAVVILFTCVLGASMLICGVLAALMQNGGWGDSIAQGMQEKPLMVPLVVTVVATIGCAVQLNGGIKGLAAAAAKADPKAPQPKKA